MTKKIVFRNLSDFKSRIDSLWINQKENETYEFLFEDNETKEEFERLEKAFNE